MTPSPDHIRKAEEIIALYAYIRGNDMVRLTAEPVCVNEGEEYGVSINAAWTSGLERSRAKSEVRDRMALDLATAIVLNGRKWRG